VLEERRTIAGRPAEVVEERAFRQSDPRREPIDAQPRGSLFSEHRDSLIEPLLPGR
jgi:hypothetical protein